MIHKDETEALDCLLKLLRELKKLTAHCATDGPYKHELAGMPADFVLSIHTRIDNQLGLIHQLADLIKPGQSSNMKKIT